MTALQTEFPPAGAGVELPPVANMPAESDPQPGTITDGAAGALIPIEIEVRGEVVSSNFLAFAGMVRARLSEINRTLSTDEDFDQAAADAKIIAGAEDALKAAKQQALADAEQLHTLFAQIDDLSGELATVRKDLAKQIDTRKEEIRREIITAALARFDEIEAPAAKAAFRKSVEESLKGKRTVATMQKAVDVVMIVHLATIKSNRGRIASFEAAHGTSMTLDFRDLELKTPDTVEAELRRRFDLKKAEEERQRLKAEADFAKLSAKQAQEALAESTKPPAPPAAPPASVPAADESSPWESGGKPLGVSEGEEWTAFENTLRGIFPAVKAAREALTHTRNIARAGVFAASMNNAWKNL